MRDEFEFGREDLEEFLHEKASASIEKLDLNPAREFLEPDWGRRSLAGWAHHKFGFAIDPESWAGLDRAEIIRQTPGQRAAALRPQGGRAAGSNRPHAVPGRSLTAHASTL